jgi:phage/plasmid-like protein (TIGR03299 family)
MPAPPGEPVATARAGAACAGLLWHPATRADTRQTEQTAMAHEIDFSNGRANIAFTGARKDIWHRLGTEITAGASIEEWTRAAGLDWHVNKSPAYCLVDGEYNRVPNFVHLTRSDTKTALGYVSEEGFKPVQPVEVLNWFDRYIKADPRFSLSCAGALRGGGRIWATASFNGELTIAGDAHKAYLLMTTGFDGSMATWNTASITRAVCNNTVSAALSDKRAQVRTTHAQRFDAAKVAKELAGIAKGFETYKAMGDALATVELAGERGTDISVFFKNVLEIPLDAPRDKISTRKMNQFDALRSAYSATVAEGTERNTAWTAWNAVTRYADHVRSVQNTEGDATSSRLASGQFGTGADLKATAWNLLLPMIKDRVAIAA